MKILSKAALVIMLIGQVHFVAAHGIHNEVETKVEPCCPGEVKQLLIPIQITFKDIIVTQPQLSYSNIAKDMSKKEIKNRKNKNLYNPTRFLSYFKGRKLAYVETKMVGKTIFQEVEILRKD